MVGHRLFQRNLTYKTKENINTATALDSSLTRYASFENEEKFDTSSYGTQCGYHLSSIIASFSMAMPNDMFPEGGLAGPISSSTFSARVDVSITRNWFYPQVGWTLEKTLEFSRSAIHQLVKVKRRRVNKSLILWSISSENDSITMGGRSDGR